MASRSGPTRAFSSSVMFSQTLVRKASPRICKRKQTCWHLTKIEVWPMQAIHYKADERLPPPFRTQSAVGRRAPCSGPTPSAPAQRASSGRSAPAVQKGDARTHTHTQTHTHTHKDIPICTYCMYCLLVPVLIRLTQHVHTKMSRHLALNKQAH